MLRLFKNIICLVLLAAMVGACARDLSSNVYTSGSTLSLTLEGTVVAVRPVVIKASDKLEDNTAGMLAGGLLGGVAGSGVGDGTGQGLAMAGAAIAGAVAGSAVQGQLGKNEGFEYIVKVDTSKLKGDYYEGSKIMRDAISSATTSGLITVVQGKDVVVPQGKKVYVIFSDDRARIVQAM